MENKNIALKICFLLGSLFINVNFCLAQLNPFQIYIRILDSIEDSHLPLNFQTHAYKTRDYSTYEKCGTVQPNDTIKNKHINANNPHFNKEIKVIEVKSNDPKKPTLTNTPN